MPAVAYRAMLNVVCTGRKPRLVAAVTKLLSFFPRGQSGLVCYLCPTHQSVYHWIATLDNSDLHCEGIVFEIARSDRACP